MNAWIQRHNFDSEDFNLPDAATAIEVFRSFDWAAEAAAAVRAPHDSCSAGLGLTSADLLLHICPYGDGHSDVFYSYPERGLLGFSKQATASASNLTGAEVEALIHLWYGNRHEEISIALEANG